MLSVIAITVVLSVTVVVLYVVVILSVTVIVVCSSTVGGCVKRLSKSGISKNGITGAGGNGKPDGSVMSSGGGGGGSQSSVSVILSKV